MSNPSPLQPLITFLTEWQAWAEGPDPEKDPSFRTTDGLCLNFSTWLRKRQYTNEEISMLHHRLFALLNRKHVPFNDVVDPVTGEFTEQYGIESYRRRSHLNPVRRAWVREFLANNQGQTK